MSKYIDLGTATCGCESRAVVDNKKTATPKKEKPEEKE